MCYSAMGEQDMKKYGGRPDYDYLKGLFKKRSEAMKLTLPRGLEYNFTKDPQSGNEKQIATLINEWHSDQVHIRQQELFKQKTRLADTERKLAAKETKKALNDKRIASNKIPWLTDKIKWHETKKPVDNDYRIFPQHYVAMAYVNEDGERMVSAFRYHLRPTYADEKWDRQRDGAYNARRDSLRKAWKNQFGKQHGLLMVYRFWENIDPKNYKADKLTGEDQAKENIVIMFEPNDGDVMLVPTIFDVWRPGTDDTLYSTALITDNPRPEIAAAGHDRTPVSLKPRSRGAMAQHCV